MSTQFQLLNERRFRPFFFTQFLGAFNDNVFKTALITLVAFHAGELTKISAATLATVLPGLFILPFFLFSATSGQIADKLDKARLMRAVKVFEIAVMCLAAVGFMTLNLTALVLALFLMGLHSTVFGPVKYAYLPQHLAEHELTGGNGLVEMGTFVAILLGQILGASVLGEHGSGLAISIVVIGIALLGWWTSRGIPLSPAADASLKINWNPVSETWRNIRFAKTNRAVWLSLLGISWFWFYGATLLTQFPNFARDTLGGNEKLFVLLLTVFSLGIGVGSVLCEKLSSDKIEIGLVPFGAIGLSLFGFDLFLASPSIPVASGATVSNFIHHFANWRILADIGLIGLFGGFYIVPLYTMIQTRSEKSHQSRVIAANNILNSAFMVVSVGISLVLFKLGLTIPQLFLATALFNVVVAAYIYTLLPEFLARFIVWMLVHTFYRLHTRGVEHIPQEGPAVLVCNHVSFVDALVISAACPRPIRFVMDHRIFKLPIIGFVFRTNRCIPIAPAREDAALLEKAYEDIAGALAEGDLIGIFPEGAITKDGDIAAFKNGVAKIVAHSPTPVIPMALRGLWGSFFSRKDGSAMTKPFRRGFLNRIELVVDAPVAASTVSPELLHSQVAALRGEWK